MKTIIRILAVTLCASILVPPASAAPAAQSGSEDFEFMAEEAKVVSASRLPQDKGRVSATVRVITGEELKMYGAQTLYDALRNVPGVDVTATDTFYAEVGVRGFSKPANNRTLILLDGRTLLEGVYDQMDWETLPVSLDEIDRIEIVEGAASAIYGANAISGVINILTKTPEQLGGGKLSYGYGERRTHLGSLLYGNRTGNLSYKGSVGWRGTHRFENADQSAAETGKGSAFVKWQFSEDHDLAISGGGANVNTRRAVGNTGINYDDGQYSFTRVDYRLGGTQVRGFWNRSRSVQRDLSVLEKTDGMANTLDLNAQHLLRLPYDIDFVAGFGLRHNEGRFGLLTPGYVEQDLWSVYGEAQWRPIESVTLLAGGRVDRHPFTGKMFSPRGAALFEPADGQLLRLSVGTAYRNPTLTENYGNFTQDLENRNTAQTGVGYTRLNVLITGNRSLAPEKITQYEAAYEVRKGDLRATVSAFHYRMKNFITGTSGEDNGTNPLPPLYGGTDPIVRSRVSFTNFGEARSWGGEFSLDAKLRQGLAAFANYAYQCTTGNIETTVSECAGPMHKVNAGLRGRKSGVSAALWGNWVGATRWESYDMDLAAAGDARKVRVPDYLLLNAYLGYAFREKLDGLELGLSVFNLANRRHYELLSARTAPEYGQYGGLIGSRVVGTLSYRF
ncbi:MAG: TonB-dependent receptor [Elusimicrobiota bacterium]|jgi:iron complex outermembrane receptor protein